MLSNPNKGKYYNAVTIALAPVGLIGTWAEGLMCEQFMVHIGGHLWYDMLIPICYLCFFAYTKTQENS